MRGPEFALVIPNDDLVVFLDVVKQLSCFWNGQGTLLVPVAEDGDFDKSLLDSLNTLCPDHVYVHPSLPTQAHEALQQR